MISLLLLWSRSRATTTTLYREREREMAPPLIRLVYIQGHREKKLQRVVSKCLKLTYTQRGGRAIAEALHCRLFEAKLD